MFKIILLATLVSLQSLLGDEKDFQPSDNSPLKNSDLESAGYGNGKRSDVGGLVKISVFYEKKSAPPTKMYLVRLLGDRDNIMPPNTEGRPIWLVGFDHHLSALDPGNKYFIEGILVEDAGFYGALVVYARNIDKISEQGGAGEAANRSVSDSEDGDEPQPESEGRSR